VPLGPGAAKLSILQHILEAPVQPWPQPLTLGDPEHDRNAGQGDSVVCRLPGCTRSGPPYVRVGSGRHLKVTEAARGHLNVQWISNDKGVLPCEDHETASVQAVGRVPA
jgi:hypothetical protein